MSATLAPIPAIKPKILIIAHGNEYIEVFSDTRDVAIKIVNVPNSTSIKGELLIEELLTLRLPPVWAKVYQDGRHLDGDAIRDVSPVDIVKRDGDIALLRTMNKIITQNNEVRPCLKVS